MNFFSWKPHKNIMGSACALEAAGPSTLVYVVYDASEVSKKARVCFHQTFQKISLSIILQCLSDGDGRVRRGAVDALLAALESFSPCDNLEHDYLSLEAHRLCQEQLSKELLGNVDDALTRASDSDVSTDKSLLKIFRGFDTAPDTNQVGDR